MSRERAGWRVVMAFLAMSGLGTACTPPRQAIGEDTSLAKSEYLIPSPQEKYSYLYLPAHLGFLAWDVYLDGAYYGYLEKENQKSPISVRVEDETLSIRLERSAFGFQESFPTNKNLAYILNPEDQRLRNMPIGIINKTIDTGGLENFQPQTTSVIPTKGSRIDNDFVYLDFDYRTKGDRYWFLIMRGCLFNDKEEPGIAFLRLIHIKGRIFFQA